MNWLLFCAGVAMPPPCVCPTDGAREGETIEQRVERLETELRLAKAEARVNRKRKTK